MPADWLKPLVVRRVVESKYIHLQNGKGNPMYYITFDFISQQRPSCFHSNGMPWHACIHAWHSMEWHEP